RARGSNFNDTISGNSGNNVLEGQNGNDVLDGRTGNDTLTGGANADTFIYGNGYGADIITDFVHGQVDKIDLTGVSGVYSLADVQAIATQVGGNTVINFGGGNTLQLNGVTASALVSSDFVFATPAPIVGDANANTLVGTSGDDTISGLDGNDTLQGLAGNDALNGGNGVDRAIYTDATGAISVNMAAGTVSG